MVRVDNIMLTIRQICFIFYYYFFYDWELEPQSCFSNTSSSNINVNNTSLISNTFSICIGDSIQVGSNYYSSAGFYNDTLLNLFGCDSIINTNLIFGSSNLININTSICAGETYYVGFNSYTLSGNYSDTISFGGCDSIINTNLTVLPSFNFQQSLSFCNGQTYSIGGNLYSQSGSFVDTLFTSNGCDSIVYSDLTFNNNFYTNNNISICEGESYIIDNNTYYSPGVYLDNFISNSGCDSIVETNLSVLPRILNYQTFVICNSDSLSTVTIGQNTYSSSGTYYDTLTSINLCDSILITNLIESEPIAELEFYNGNLIGYSVSGVEPLFYQIFGPSGLISNNFYNLGDTLTIAPIELGNYYFICTDNLGCEDSSTFEFSVSSINNFNDFSFKVFPNPTSKDLTISLNSPDLQNINIKIKSILGQEILKRNLLNFIGKYSETINLSNYNKGIYIISVELNKTIYNSKIILK